MARHIRKQGSRKSGMSNVRPMGQIWPELLFSLAWVMGLVGVACHRIWGLWALMDIVAGKGEGGGTDE